MRTDTTTLERAFQLARSGEFDSVATIAKQLKAEGYALQQLEGATLKRQLRETCEAAMASKAKA